MMSSLPPAAGNSPSILIVEDDYLVAMEAEAALAEAGYDIVGIVASAQEALAAARESCPSLIVMDIRIAGETDGVEAALRIHEATGIRCLFASAHVDPDVQARAAPARPLGWLSKPYMPGTLVRTVAAALAEG